MKDYPNDLNNYLYHLNNLKSLILAIKLSEIINQRNKNESNKEVNNEK